MKVIYSDYMKVITACVLLKVHYPWHRYVINANGNFFVGAAVGEIGKIQVPESLNVIIFVNLFGNFYPMCILG